MTNAYDSIVVLDEDGLLTARGARGRYRLALVTGDRPAWHVTGPVGPAGEAPLAAMAAGLEDALVLLGRAAFGPRPVRTTVMLPCGNEFSRPGRVAVESILAAFGYEVISRLTGYAGKAFAVGTPEEDVRAAFHQAATSSGMVAGEPSLVESDAAGDHWAVDVTYPFAGVIRRGTAAAVLSEAILEAGLDVIDEMECEATGDHPANAAAIYHLRRLTDAA